MPPFDVTVPLRAELAVYPEYGALQQGLRWSPPDQWHITLSYYGALRDPGGRAETLRTVFAQCRRPTVRLAGSGTFGRVLWLGVEDLGEGDLDLLAALAGGSERDYVPHLTLARADSSVARVDPEWTRRLQRYESASWTVSEVALLRSDPGQGGPVYTEVERFPLTAGRGGPVVGW